MSHITTFGHHDSRGGGGAPPPPDKPPASRRRLRHIGAVLAGSIVVAVLLLVVANLAFAQSAQKKNPPDLKPFLVEDIYPGKTGSEPNWLVDFKGRLLFGANHPRFGEELWRSNGTRSGTRLVKDIDPGPLVIKKMEKTETGSSAPDSVLRTKKWIYFQATTVKYGEELWKSDGTEWGTKIVKDIVSGPGDSGPEDIVSTAPRTTFFRAWDKKHGEELWKTDGTERGTKLIKDINPDLPPGARCDQGECGIPKGWSHPDTVTVMGKQVFFAADDGKHGVELWKSDGTEKGTTLVKDINTVPGNSNPNDKGDAINRSAEVEKLYVVGKTLYFRASDGKHGVELWKTDGTERGTKLVKDINTGPDDSNPDSLTAFKGRLLFSADDGVHGSEMWRSNGTKANTALLINLEPGAVGSEPGELTISGPLLYFAASTPSAGEELWAVVPRGIGR
jgi:ELWxxDGT repeat protein